MKKFMKKTEGFTLVELIVVIAILGILAGVGTVGYSGYIKKANQAKDVQMISEIEHALTLAGYSGTFANGDNGCIILSANGEVEGVEAGSNLHKALVATFGEGYKDILKLSYNGWGSNGLYDNLTPETAFAVAQSSYMTGTRANDLLADVETMTNMANNLVTVLSAGNSYGEGTTLSRMFTKDDGTCVLDKTAEKYGIKKDENQTWEQWAASNSGANQAAYSNLLVLAAADESEKYMGGRLGTGDAYEMSAASNMILEFSSFYAYAAVNDEFSGTLDTYLAHLNGEETDLTLSAVTNASTGAAWYNALKNAAGDGYNTYLGSTNSTTGTSQAEMDTIGFLSILAGVGNPSKEQADRVAADLNNTNLFTNGVVNGMYNDYLDGVDVMNGMYDPDAGTENNWNLGLGEGNVAIMVAQRGGQTVVADSLPDAQ